MNKCPTLVNRTVIAHVDLAHSTFISGSQLKHQQGGEDRGKSKESD